MSDTLVTNHLSAKTTYLKDYQPSLFLIDEINLDFELYDDHALVHSQIKIRLDISRAQTSTSTPLKLDGEALELLSLQLNGEEIPKSQYTVSEHNLIIVDVPQMFELAMTVKIFPQQNTALSGLYRSRKTFCTQCEAEGFRRITYFLDRPDVLTRFTTTISADENVYPILLSNGNLIATRKLENGRHWVKWIDPFKKSSYLFALVAGDFDLLSDTFRTISNRLIDLRIFVEKGYGDQASHAMYSLKEAMRWDEKVYGREYDLDIYMIVAIGDFNMGAMENKGLNIFNTKYILAKPETATDGDYMHILSVVGHEYFHNWSGNRVTCRDWFQLSLKEGLTIFRDQNFTEDTLSHAVMRIEEVSALRETQFPEDAGPLAHSVRPESYIEINNFYTATVYNKGAEVLRMLRTILGKEKFREGMDLYFSRFDGQAVTIEDYIRTMEEIANTDLAQFRLWYTQAGTPTVSMTEDYDGAKKVYTLTFHQICPATPHQPEKKPMIIPIRMGLLAQTGEEMLIHLDKEKAESEKVLILNQASQIFRFNKIAERPIPSLFRDFSAPVIFNYAYSNNDLLFLAKHDKDDFNRFEASQTFMLRMILSLIRDYQQAVTLCLPEELVEMYRYILTCDMQDKFLLAEMLSLPSEKYIAEQMKIIDVNAIFAVREFLLANIASQLDALFLDQYRNNNHSQLAYMFNIQEIGKRQLKNRCLAFLMLLPKYIQIGIQQFSAALKINMTDTQSALIALTNLNFKERDSVLEEFYITWKGDALVVDKWLALQAGTKLPIALQQIKKLMRHEAFDIKNPNKVYALIGTFGFRNSVNFHVETGEGYAFLRETVQQLDKINPQIAARMIKPLTTWKRYDKERQELMCEQLNLLLQNNKLSRDVFEIVSKSLEG